MQVDASTIDRRRRGTCEAMCVNSEPFRSAILRDIIRGLRYIRNAFSIEHEAVETARKRVTDSTTHTPRHDLRARKLGVN